MGLTSYIKPKLFVKRQTEKIWTFDKTVTGNFAKFKVWREIRGMFHCLGIQKRGVELRMI